MRLPTLLAKHLLLGVLAFSQHATAACTKSIKAQPSDTCATLAAAAGITVTQFLRSNPSVTSCAQLTSGALYCVEGTADNNAPAATSSASPPSNTLTISSDGTCGAGVTCAGSRFGSCCSAHGFCGSTQDYCAVGSCQPAFGLCGDQQTVTGPPPNSFTVTVTATAAVTRTSVIFQTILQTSIVVVSTTATATVGRTATATAVVTQTIPFTATAIVTRTVPVTATAVVTQTVRTTAAATAVVTLTSISTSTRVVTSVKLETLTTIVTSLSTKTLTLTSITGVCSGGGGPIITSLWPPTLIQPTPTLTRPGIVTTTVISGGKPTPTLPGTPRGCRAYDLILDGDNCRRVAQRNDLTLLEFYDINPSIDCDNLWPGYYVCVQG